ncbi:White collar-2 protein [Lasiodiplodia theobromae]|uniref:White collar 2 protein n=1 Tax=Lasiodiplodia theobromae TaxID=45133 RepID=A0A5N5DR96_9PEZI|nr:White collar-2 protein [Lasiodiplodia theobromae]KAB2580498.1 White collar 2 protein [Lasiodiplodia theobromae]KAF4541076.1 White collar-2 protein [Lasiodiplodia theobromae]
MTTPDRSLLDDAVVDPSTPTAIADSQLAPQSHVDALDDILLSSLHDLHFILSPSTTILRVSANCLNLLGCEPNLLLGQRLAALVHKDDAHVFSSEIDDALLRPSNSVLIDSGAFDASLSTVAPRRPPFRFYCRIRSVVHLGSDYSAFELVGHYQVKMPASLSPLQLMMPPPGIISITARPAFSRKGRLMDGMLELKMEQIRLVRLIRKMRREAEEGHYEGDDEEEEAVLTIAATPAPMHHHHSFQQVEERVLLKSTRRPSTPGGASKRSRSSPPRLTWMASTAEQQQQQPEQQTEPEPISSPWNTQSNGDASPGDASPKVKLGDAGIPFFIRPEGYERKTSDVPRQPKRKFVAKDYCCSRCGTVESPEWRAGPDGPKTLCNACGLKYAKEQKRAEKLKQDVVP